LVRTCPELIVTVNEKGKTVELCGRQLLKGSDRCIFHDPYAWRTHAKLMRKEVKEKIKKGDLIFQKYHFPKIDFSKITQEFEGQVDFSNASFHGDAFFNDIVFSGPANFLRASFQRTAKFTHAKFSESVHFHGTKFLRDVWFTATKFLGRTWFTDVEFSGDVYFDSAEFYKATLFFNAKLIAETVFSSAQFSSRTNFINTEFLGIARFSRVKFAGPSRFDVKFSRDVYFNSTRFLRDAWFKHTKFSGRAEFTNVKFAGTARFTHAKFSKTKKTIFTHAKFLGAARFTHAEFLGTTMFIKAEFSGETSFVATEFSGEVRFTDAKFLGTTRFDDVEFLGDVYFDSAEFLRDAWFKHAKFARKAHADFSFSRFHEIVAFGKLIMSDINFAFENALFERGLSVDETSWRKSEFRLLIEKVDLALAAESYHALRRGFGNMGHYGVAGELFYREMTCRKYMASPITYSDSIRFPRWFRSLIQPTVRIESLHPILSKIALLLRVRIRWNKLRQWLWMQTFSITCGFGERPWSVVRLSAATIFIFALVYFSWIRTSMTFLESALTAIYLSFDSFVALGTTQGDILPISYRWLTYLEAVLGLFMMSLFLVVFTRKMSRG